MGPNTLKMSKFSSDSTIKCLVARKRGQANITKMEFTKDYRPTGWLCRLQTDGESLGIHLSYPRQVGSRWSIGSPSLQCRDFAQSSECHDGVDELIFIKSLAHLHWESRDLLSCMKISRQATCENGGCYKMCRFVIPVTGYIYMIASLLQKTVVWRRYRSYLMNLDILGVGRSESVAAAIF